MTVETKTTKVVVDVEITNHGSLIAFWPRTDAAIEWVDENVEIPDHLWMGGGAASRFHVEPRFADDLIAGMESEGLVVV